MKRSELEALWTECFGNEGNWIGCFFETAFREENTHLIYRSDRLAAGLCWMDVFCESGKFSYLFAIATASDFRHQGLCRTLMSQTHAILEKRGYTGSILVPADSGLRRMYEKMGYVNFSGIQYLSVSSGDPIPIRKVSPTEYAVLRRHFLPEGGAVQEDGAIEFLASGAELYAGKDFLTAVSGNLGIELLGNTDAASGILADLSLKTGTFRTPGDDPFAMFRSFTASPAPTYFGLAFD